MESTETMTPSATPRPVHVTGIAASEKPRFCSLERALEYRNDQILYKFLERWDVTFDEASELFEEMKKWLWVQVAARHREGSPSMAMTESLAMLDEMLHTFILFTREYIKYCQEVYGVYLHHTPMTKQQKDARVEASKRDPEQVLAQEAEFLSNMYAFVYDLLGEETVVKWYGEYPEKYSGPRMAELTKTRGRRFALGEEVDSR
jgi:hypothetical protein